MLFLLVVLEKQIWLKMSLLSVLDHNKLGAYNMDHFKFSSHNEWRMQLFFLKKLGFINHGTTLHHVSSFVVLSSQYLLFSFYPSQPPLHHILTPPSSPLAQHIYVGIGMVLLPSHTFSLHHPPTHSYTS